MTPMHNPPHPGRVLKDWIPDSSVPEVAAQLGVSAEYLSAVLNEQAAITPELSSKLSALLGTSDGFWTRMQAKRDAWLAAQVVS